MASFAPAVDIFESEDSITIKAEIPGLEARDVNIDVDNNVLTVRGERKLENEEKKEGYHRIERSYGAFSRSFVMPNTVDAEKIEASMTNGVLQIVLPKKAVKQARKVNIKGAVGGEAPRPEMPATAGQSTGAPQGASQGASQGAVTAGSIPQGGGNGHRVQVQGGK